MEPHHPSDIVPSCFDPFGRNVVATLGRWEEHIEGGHPEVDEHFAAAQSTVEAPEIVTADAKNQTRENFYRRGVLPPPFDRLYLKVCVAYGPGRVLGAFLIGQVVTAYPTRTIGRGEAQRWP